MHGVPDSCRTGSTGFELYNRGSNDYQYQRHRISVIPISATFKFHWQFDFGSV